LEAVVEDVVAKGDIPVPSCWIANMPIKSVLGHTAIKMIALREVHHCKNWYFFPFGMTEEILRLGDVDIGWDIVKELGERGKCDMVMATTSYQVYVKTDDGRSDDYVT
jgi:hypothetical protein